MNVKNFSLACLALLVAATAFAASKDPTTSNIYYKKGKVYQCIVDNGLAIDDEKIKSRLLDITSRDRFNSDAVEGILKSKPQFVKENIETYLFLSARYEEGRNSIRLLMGKDPFMSIDECNLVVPYIEKDILKSKIKEKSQTQENSPLISSWDELEKTDK
ncbi:hypothetical protein [Candidatus Erwinia dacicola]|uniref:Uncharacterized protein n=1 Tax=Candidatus Erwinia dacicola TaxID=252393 RepID=A0A1E7YUJ6_9GAMM|nr:hypothetical protein [Candidatus Erwinia dacicola]OFC58163.1 hypothetical protein BBW68_03300 [Candidatus Erwinia dacicola]RAP70178.1 hypothetical protein ACZ87_03020 [Candidatus Erwinia dacicola]